MDILEEMDLLGKRLFKYNKIRKDLYKVWTRVNIQHKLYTRSFLVWRGEYKVYILILIGVAMLSSFLTLILHCCLIVGKESDKNWEEEQIMKKEETEE